MTKIKVVLGDNFVKKFDSELSRNDKKNKPIIDALANLLHCPIDEVNSAKINEIISEIEDCEIRVRTVSLTHDLVKFLVEII